MLGVHVLIYQMSGFNCQESELHGPLRGAAWSYLLSRFSTNLAAALSEIAKRDHRGNRSKAGVVFFLGNHQSGPRHSPLFHSLSQHRSHAVELGLIGAACLYARVFIESCIIHRLIVR